MSFPRARPRRLRQSAALRSLVKETHLSASDLIQPVFILPGKQVREPVLSMPGVDRLSVDLLLVYIEKLVAVGVNAIALFPVLPAASKTPGGESAFDPKGLVPEAIRTIKERFPNLCIIADIALDPYTSHGQDGLINESGLILNDETVSVLVKQALCYAEAGVDVVAPSDMMDGRIGAIRDALEVHGYHDIVLLSYAAKYASAFYGPFRDAVGSSAQLGSADKKTYQMDPANQREALKEAWLDIEEGADILMVKPGLPYLDVLHLLKQEVEIPIFAYHVSGEYAMIMAAAEKGWLDPQATLYESVLALKRAGADAILTYAALDIAASLSS